MGGPTQTAATALQRAHVLTGTSSAVLVASCSAPHEEDRQGDMESFISDQIVEKLEVVVALPCACSLVPDYHCHQARLESRIDEKKEHTSEKLQHRAQAHSSAAASHPPAGKLKLAYESQKEENLLEHKRTMRLLNEEKRVLEDKLDDEKHTRFNRVRCHPLLQPPCGLYLALTWLMVALMLG